MSSSSFFIENITRTFQNRVRIAFVGYRDHSDGAMRIETLSFTESVPEFKEFVNGKNSSLVYFNSNISCSLSLVVEVESICHLHSLSK